MKSALSREIDYLEQRAEQRHRLRRLRVLPNRTPSRPARPRTRDGRGLAVAKILRSLKYAPCEDCGHRYPPACMDFHHTGPKRFLLAHAYRRSVPEVLKELEACILVCSNCHRLRHAR